MKSTRALTGIEVAAGIAVVGLLGWLLLPKVFHGASRRANQSTQATAELLEAQRAQGASAAASVAKASPVRDFIAQEVPVALSQLPAPDPKALIEAERRKVAVLEGRLEEARDLYSSAALRAERLQKDLAEAVEARQRADLALEQAAAAERARTIQAGAAVLLAVLIGAAWLWLKFNAGRLRGVLSRVVPTLDQAYESADDTGRKLLDAAVFDPLSRAMDKKDKALVHTLRARI
jgi:hypothetical protein